MTAEEKSAKPFADLVGEASKNWEQIVKNAFKAQQESVHWWAGMLGETGPGAQPRARAVLDEIAPQAQKNMNEWLKVMEENSRLGVDLLKKSIAITQSQSLQDAQNRLTTLWEATINAAAEGAQAITQATTKTVGASIEAVRKASQAAEPASKT